MMINLNSLPCKAIMAWFVFLMMGATSLAIPNSALAQSATDNATNTTAMAAENMTASAVNMTGANMTQNGNISGCGNECF